MFRNFVPFDAIVNGLFPIPHPAFDQGLYLVLTAFELMLPTLVLSDRYLLPFLAETVNLFKKKIIHCF